MDESVEGSIASILFDHQLLVKIQNLCYGLTRIKLTCVLSGENGWEQFSPKGETSMPSFCRLIQSVPDGAKHCNMCHVLMTVAAYSSGLAVQKCHTGVSVLVLPIKSSDSSSPQAVLSSCIFTSRARSKAWKEAEERGRKLKLDITELRTAFDELPSLNESEINTTVSFMEAAAEAVKEIRTGLALRDKIARAHKHIQLRSMAEAVVSEKLRCFGAKASAKSSKPGKCEQSAPAVINVVRETVLKRPEFHFNVTDISAAARMTPNHFSSLFHKHCGQTFSDFVTETRIRKAKDLLGDFTLNISEVAARSGFEDPGYFARRFRQLQGCTPREWREKLA